MRGSVLEMLSGSRWRSSPETRQADVWSTMETDPAEWTRFRLISWSFLGISPAIASLDKKHSGAVFSILFFIKHFSFRSFWLGYRKFAYVLSKKLSSHSLIDLRLHPLARGDFPGPARDLSERAGRGVLLSGAGLTQHRGFIPACNSGRTLLGFSKLVVQFYLISCLILKILRLPHVCDKYPVLGVLIYLKN